METIPPQQQKQVQQNSVQQVTTDPSKKQPLPPLNPVGTGVLQKRLRSKSQIQRQVPFVRIAMLFWSLFALYAKIMFRFMILSLTSHPNSRI